LNPECRSITLELVVEEYGLLRNWIKYLREHGMTDTAIMEYTTAPGFIDEEIEGALIELGRKP